MRHYILNITVLWSLLLHLLQMNHLATNSKVITTTDGGQIRFFDWRIEYANVSRLCQSKMIMTVNGQFPGPTQYVREGDMVKVRVTNLVNDGITIHWHGVRQLRTCWADGPAFVTQCPLQPNQTYVYRFNIVKQRGTLLWHAHYSWQRAILHGAFIIFPKNHIPYPFAAPRKELAPIILGEWWIADVEEVIAEALLYGGTANASDALTINGQPGILYNCSQDGVVVYNVEYGTTYLLRLINAAMELQLYFAIANHTVTVVEADAEYTEPYETDMVVIAPGQTLNLLVHTKESYSSTQPTRFLMAASAFAEVSEFPATATTAVWAYETLPWIEPVPADIATLRLPMFPASHNTTYVYNFYRDSLQSQPFSRGYYYMDLPVEVDYNFFYTVGYGTQPCPANFTCLGPGRAKFSATVSNISFVDPSPSILEAYYYQLPGVYETDFPDRPETEYNYSGEAPHNTMTKNTTKVRVLPFNSAVQVVFQGTSMVVATNHPLHLHGQNFWVVGMGLGNFDPISDPSSFNLVNPVSRNTIVVPTLGWAAIRFRTLNPGVWYLHCHLDLHQSWGMSMAFIVQNGDGEEETLPPPPIDFPTC